MAACSNWPSAAAGIARHHHGTLIPYDNDTDDDRVHRYVDMMVIITKIMLMCV